ncbi:MAG: twin-arginine translocation pathway signal protein [Novosphingobium sp. 28-62-57]|uniref:twin-arginine translocation pathway signal protein n=1 Tax=unclassified Novosphingobium TaxID=2644732 RepID=UPI000BD6DFD9|nr:MULTISPECIES: twin-arginine translocation pathway signal protein [unclassified Novosphingobium]OYW51370.1 MAG: twin-arginine translocation pathway signal protein [Novosphingobium sp. 12-62-10]OYZ10494.1 MAG: twin-arginine translocation pathway signal protein [Novosphingobium sp. 28-62-57]OZA40625.1 MAG: twin-arginine translocation pathway signal protein [Novosphingobium sp. 17-62-9]HQS68106.1 twin-arginine translocation pathway signal protein [Novosphingobium sp.]
MGLRISGAALALAALALASSPALAQTAAPAATAQPAPLLVPADFKVPTLVEGPGFKLVPLGPDLVKVDFDAYMSSIEHLQKTFSRSTSWPHPGITDADAMKDMEGEQARFQARKSFAYGVLTPDGKREMGSVYVSPSRAPGYDAMVRMWVTKADYDAGFDAQLYAWVQAWVAKEWPFARVAYPGRAIAWDEWDAKLAAAKAK